MTTEQLQPDSRYIIDAQREEINRLEDNRMYLIACLSQLSAQNAELAQAMSEMLAAQQAQQAAAAMPQDTSILNGKALREAE